jgi:NAD(P)H-hydrate epimerase
MAPPGARVAIVCGRGNNGGDGLVAARHLADWGRRVEVVLTAPPESMSGDAALQLAAVRALDLPIHPATDEAAFEYLPAPGSFAVVVDALLGTGLKGEVRGLAVEAIAWMNGQGVPVLAVDTPSGLCGDTGRVLGAAVRATRTVTLAASKLGHWLHPGPDHVGELVVADIGIPEASLAGRGPERRVLDDADLAPVCAPRPENAHKGTFGHVYVLAGSVGRTGAARMVADAAMRAGAGLVTIGTTPEALTQIGAQVYEVMTEVGFGDVEQLAARLASRDALVVGPGMPVDAAHRALLLDLLPRLDVPAVIDADALNHASSAPEVLRRGGPKVLTPHPGEAARLLGATTQDVQADRAGAATRLARLTGAVVVLKGAHTLVARPDGGLALCPDGNPGMASAGMGDVLAGIIGALLARGLSPEAAAAAGVLWHARAGDVAAERGTPTTLIARDVIAALAEAEKRTCCRA